MTEEDFKHFTVYGLKIWDVAFKNLFVFRPFNKSIAV